MAGGPLKPDPATPLTTVRQNAARPGCLWTRLSAPTHPCGKPHDRDTPQRHREAAGEDARQVCGPVTAKAGSECGARLLRSFPNPKRLLQTSGKTGRGARGGKPSVRPAQLATRRPAKVEPPQTPGTGRREQRRPRWCGGCRAGTQNAAPESAALVARTCPRPPARDTVVRTTDPLQHATCVRGPRAAARTACAPGRETGVAGGAPRATPPRTDPRRNTRRRLP